MNKLRMSTLAATLGALGLVGAAQAADLRHQEQEPAAPMVIQPIFTWTGARIGAFGGYGISQTNVKNFNTNAAYKNTNGWLGGALIGYDYQIGHFILGAVADFAGAQMRRGIQSFSDPNLAGSNIRIRYFGTVRARLGYAVDRALIYGTGGWAYIGLKGYFPALLNINAPSLYKTNKSGWAVGGGIDYAVTDNVIASLDYLYLAPQKAEFGVGYTLFNGGQGIKIRERTSVISASIAYKF